MSDCTGTFGRLLTRLFRRYDIARKGLDRYLTRWDLLGNRFAGAGHHLFVHLFHRGDAEPYFHDHPWPFWSLILWGGYWEHTPEGRRWYGPLRLLRRPADWRHRVELPAGRRCWTLVWTGAKARSWGFWCPRSGFLPWRQHQANQDAGLPGCGLEPSERATAAAAGQRSPHDSGESAPEGNRSS